MHTKDAIRSVMDLSSTVFKSYISDLEGDELLKRPGQGCNHPAWQCGHLISSEVSLLKSICPGKEALLPTGFGDAHSKETAASDDASAFYTKNEYLELMERARAATLTALDEISDESLDEPSPEHLRDFCPTVGHVFLLIASHPMMHAGQIVPVRRELGKPVVF